MYVLTRYSAFVEAVIVIYRKWHQQFWLRLPTDDECSKSYPFPENGIRNAHFPSSLMSVSPMPAKFRRLESFWKTDRAICFWLGGRRKCVAPSFSSLEHHFSKIHYSYNDHPDLGRLAEKPLPNVYTPDILCRCLGSRVRIDRNISAEFGMWAALLLIDLKKKIWHAYDLKLSPTLSHHILAATQHIPAQLYLYPGCFSFFTMEVRSSIVSLNPTPHKQLLADCGRSSDVRIDGHTSFQSLSVDFENFGNS